MMKEVFAFLNGAFFATILIIMIWAVVFIVDTSLSLKEKDDDVIVSEDPEELTDGEQDSRFASVADPEE